MSGAVAAALQARGAGVFSAVLASDNKSLKAWRLEAKNKLLDQKNQLTKSKWCGWSDMEIEWTVTTRTGVKLQSIMRTLLFHRLGMLKPLKLLTVFMGRAIK